MKHIYRGVIALCCYGGIHQAQAQSALQLWYRQPAAKWTEALPIGNGQLGGMIYGEVRKEHIQFNEATLWTGRPREYAHPGAVQYLQPIRALLSAGKQAEAEALAQDHFMGLKDVEDSAYLVARKQWLQQVRTNEANAQPQADDRQWKELKLPMLNGWEAMGLDGLDGAVWFRTGFDLPAGWKGKNLMLVLGKIRDMDFTYVNGKQVGAGEGISTKRTYKIDASVLHEGKNTIAIQVINFYDKGGFAGTKGSEELFVVYPEGGDPKENVKLPAAWKYHVQNDAPPVYPQYEASYQPFGDVYFRMDAHHQNYSDYKRELDISSAISRVTYTGDDGAHYTREYFASAPSHTLVMHFTVDKERYLDLTASLASAHSNYIVKRVNDSTLALYVQVRGGALRGVSYLQVRTRGSVAVSNNTIVIKGAAEATFYLSAATNYKNYKDVSGNPEARCSQALLQAKGTYATIKATHIKDYTKLFSSFDLNLGTGINATLPTDARIRQFAIDKDPSLFTLYTQYGRYLLISSSRSGGQPANLQGLWNELLTPPWGSKFTTNINLEMNYWPAEILNLSACTQPLFAMMEELSQAGQQTATVHYGAPGWVLHHNTDIWKATAPINSSTHGIWVSGAAWLSHHIWEHYLFTQDLAFLKKYYPIMKSSAAFFNSFLVRDPATGKLISTPSNSPEQGGLVAGPAMDHQIIRDIYKNCIAAATVLKTDAADRKIWQQQYNQVAPNHIGKYHQLQEWQQDIDDTTSTHRHVSHLWGVFPGTDITWQQPDMMKAARQSLLYRGDDGTGWSLAWKVNLWARFKEGDHAFMMLNKLLSSAEGASGAERGGVYDNLFDAHPPFQIDGNFGGAAGLAEMLLQSQGTSIELLPALPAALPDGEVKGLCARGGFVIGMKWTRGQLHQVTVTSLAGKICHLTYGKHRKDFATVKGKTYLLNAMLQ